MANGAYTIKRARMPSARLEEKQGIDQEMDGNDKTRKTAKTFPQNPQQIFPEHKTRKRKLSRPKTAQKETNIYRLRFWHKMEEEKEVKLIFPH